MVYKVLRGQHSYAPESLPQDASPGLITFLYLPRGVARG